MQQITNGQRPATKQRDTDIIISRQTQNNIWNLKISDQYAKATQNNKQNKNEYGQSIQHNKKRMQSKEKIDSTRAVNRQPGYRPGRLVGPCASHRNRKRDNDIWGGAVNRQPGYRARNLQRRGFASARSFQLLNTSGQSFIKFEIFKFFRFFDPITPQISKPLQWGLPPLFSSEWAETFQKF